MEYIEEIQEQVILVGVQLDENDNVKESLDELEELADTAGAQTVGKLSRTVRLYILELILERKDRGGTCSYVGHGCYRNYL